MRVTGLKPSSGSAAFAINVVVEVTRSEGDPPDWFEATVYKSPFYPLTFYLQPQPPLSLAAAAFVCSEPHFWQQNS